MAQADKDFLAGLSGQGKAALAKLVAASDALHAAFAAHPGDPVRALYAAPDFAGVLDEIDAMGSAHAGDGAGDDVSGEDARRNGTLIWVDPDGSLHPITLGAALTGRVAKSVAFVIAGAGRPIVDVIGDLPDWRGRLGLNGLVLQYAGIDRRHWSPEVAVGVLEVNLLQAAAAQVLNSAMNKAGRTCLVISEGFGCWVANRALRLLPVRKVWYARNLQIDALGGRETMAELTAAKKDGFGSICHVQGRQGRATLAQVFALSDADLKAIPVDIRA